MIASIILVLAAATPNPLAKADDGYVQCYEPDDKGKTCRSISAYKRNGDGTWANTAEVLISPKATVSLESVTNVTIEHGAVCGYVRGEDLLKGKLRISGQLISDEKAAPILAKIAAGMASLANKKVCTEYVQDAQGLVAKGRVDGLTIAIPDQRVKWIRPDDGYIVAPSAPRSAAADPDG